MWGCNLYIFAMTRFGLFPAARLVPSTFGTVPLSVRIRKGRERTRRGGDNGFPLKAAYLWWSLLMIANEERLLATNLMAFLSLTISILLLRKTTTREDTHVHTINAGHKRCYVTRAALLSYGIIPLAPHEPVTPNQIRIKAIPVIRTLCQPRVYNM